MDTKGEKRISDCFNGNLRDNVDFFYFSFLLLSPT